MEGIPNADWVFRVGTEEKRAHHHRHYVQFRLQQIESTLSSRSDKQLAEAYQAAYGDEQPQFPHLFERRPDWLITMWSASNVQVLHASLQMRTLRSGWREMRPVFEELLAAWLRERPPMNKEIVTEVNAAVEHIHKSTVDRADMANWPNHGPVMDSDCLAHCGPCDYRVHTVEPMVKDKA